MTGSSSKHGAAARRAVATLLALLLAGVFLAVPVPANAADKGRVRGEILSHSGPVSRVKLLWFDAQWNYLGGRRFKGGGYSLSLAPGTYYLQAADMAPSYDVTKNAPSTVKVTVRAGHTTAKNIRMSRGASIGGSVKAGGKNAGGARVVAANTDEQSFQTTADKSGHFALGGLPPGNYSVFTYDRKAAFVGKSLYLPKLKGPTYTPVAIKLKKKAGSLLVDLYAGKKPMRAKAFVTAVSRTTGQFWTAKATRGSVTFRGLYPGRYYLEVPGVDNYLPARVRVKTKVRSGRVAFGSARLTKKGAKITGKVIDRDHPDISLAGASLQLFDASGQLIDTATSRSSGAFTLDGQLTTQKGMTVVAGPGPGSSYLGQGTPHNCKYGTAKVRGVKVSTGKRTAVGKVALPHLPDDQQDGAQCWTSSDSTES